MYENGVLWRAKMSEIRLKSELSHSWNQSFFVLNSHCKPVAEKRKEKKRREEKKKKKNLKSKIFTWCHLECRVLWYRRAPGCRFHTSWICPSSCCTGPGGSHGRRSAGCTCYPTHPAFPAHCITEKKWKNKQAKLTRNTVIYKRIKRNMNKPNWLKRW